MLIFDCRAVKAAEQYGVVSMVDVVLNHRTASKLSETTGDWTSFEGPDWEEWAVVAVSFCVCSGKLFLIGRLEGFLNARPLLIR